jgi:hypothetical protein
MANNLHPGQSIESLLGGSAEFAAKPASLLMAGVASILSETTHLQTIEGGITPSKLAAGILLADVLGKTAYMVGESGLGHTVAAIAGIEILRDALATKAPDQKTKGNVVSVKTPKLH